MNKSIKGQKCPEPRKIRDPDVQPLPLPKEHKCFGCVWYPRDVDILYCPFRDCIRYRKGFDTKDSLQEEGNA